MGNLRPRRSVVAILLTTLALTALFVAQGTTRLLISALLPVEPEVSAPVVRAAAVNNRSSAVDPTVILRRNIFDSQTGALDAVATTEAEATPEAAPPAPIDPNAPPAPCDGSFRLVASIVNERHPDLSYAALIGAAGKALVYRPGMRFEDREVVAVRSEGVLLRPSSGAVCSVAMFVRPEPGATPTPAIAAATPPTPAEATAPPPGTGGGDPTLDANITRVSDTQYTIQRALVDRLLQNRSELMSAARIIPHEEGGRTVGVKLYGIRRNSLLGKLGLQNGDMLRTINGYDMTSPDSALEAYTRLRTASNLSLSIVRRGQTLSMDYTIQ